MFGAKKNLSDIYARLEKLEAQMGFLMRSLGLEPGTVGQWTASQEVQDLVDQGEIKAAIKAFRNETGASLKEAKTFVESLMR